MALNHYDEIFAGHLWLARIGDGSVTRTAAPASDAATWIKMEDSQEFSLTADIETREKDGISLGQRVRKKIVPIRRKFGMTAPINSLNKMWFDTLYQSATTATDAVVSHGFNGEAWVRLQAYTGNDVMRFIIQGLAYVSIDGDINFNDDFPSATFKVDFLNFISGSFVSAYTS